MYGKSHCDVNVTILTRKSHGTILVESESDAKLDAKSHRVAAP